MPNEISPLPREIPILDVGRRGALGLYEEAAADAAAVIASAMGAHALLGLVAGLGDRMSRRWLKRRSNPYYEEIAAVARALDRPGVFLLNIVYEWACSTSAGPDPLGPGNRLIRVLDWGLPGLGRYLVIGRHESDHGTYFNATWPGYAGVLTGMAPGRFSSAINQAPRQTPTRIRWLDEIIVHLEMFRTSGTIPISHLLRRVFEEAPDYAAAVAMLTDESIALAAPALVTLSGVRPEESCVVEAIGHRRIRHPAEAARGGIIGVANDWLSPDLPGEARDNALAGSGHESPKASNTERRRTICRLQRGAFDGVADLAPPVLNGHTVLVATANALEGTLRVQSLEQVDRQGLPRIISHASIVAA